MKYLLMVYCDEAADARKTASEQEAEMGAYLGLSQALRSSGGYLAGEALHPTATATTVRVRNGQILTTDGPFAETKEQLGGYYLVNCRDLDEAIQWAAKVPHAAQSAIEIRPVMEFPQAATA